MKVRYEYSVPRDVAPLLISAWRGWMPLTDAIIVDGYLARLWTRTA